MITTPAPILAGAALFATRLGPRWFDGVELAALDMADPEKCVAGQLCPPDVFRHYSVLRLPHLRYTACVTWLSGGLGDAARAPWSIRHGLLAAGSGRSGPVLTAGWKAHIVSLRAEAGAR